MRRSRNAQAGTPQPRRAANGSVEAHYLLKLPLELDTRVRNAAAREGVKVAEWWRRAAAERLGGRA